MLDLSTMTIVLERGRRSGGGGIEGRGMTIGRGGKEDNAGMGERNLFEPAKN